jgi:predicted RNA binding protein YcfA (HicA-like mRNA interferase family)
VALDELIDRYRRASDEREVAVTVRQLAEAGGMTRMAASRALEVLANKGFIAVMNKGSYEAKRKPSRYRLTMFPYKGREPTHDYIEDVRAWRKQRRPKAFTPPPTSVKLQVRVPIKKLTEFVEQNERFIAASECSP